MNKALRLLWSGLALLALSVVACTPPQTAPLPTAIPPTHAVVNPTQVSTSAAGTPTRAPAGPTPAATPTVDKEMAVLQAVAQLACQAPSGAPPQVTAAGATYTLACVFAAGHSTAVRIQRFGSAAEAQAAFGNAVQGHPTQDFHGYPAAAWEEKAFETPTAKRRLYVWQADRWLVRVESFDDTAYLVALEPGKVAESVYQAAVQQGLWPR